MGRSFGSNELLFLVYAAQWTLLLSLIAVVGGASLAAVVTLARVSPTKLLRQAAAAYIQVVQGTPVLIQLLFVYYGTAFLGFRADPWWSACTALIINSSAFFAEIWRGTIEAVPRGQWEGGQALGLSHAVVLRRIIAPQALRLMLAPSVGYMVQIIKATPVVSLIGVSELARAAIVINNLTFDPLPVFAAVSALYFLLCWPLSVLSRYLDRRMRT